jgi:hypothetical protein
MRPHTLVTPPDTHLRFSFENADSASGHAPGTLSSVRVAHSAHLGMKRHAAVARGGGTLDGMNQLRRYALYCLAAASVATSACGSSPSGPSGSTGTLNLRITDSPYSDARALLVTFSQVSVHRADTPDTAWVTLPFAEAATTRTCDLKKLVNAQDILGTGPLATGHYTQVRLTVSQATLYLDNPSAGAACASALVPPGGRSAAVEVSSGEVKLNREFDVAAGGSTTMVVDFDGDRSVIQQGNGAYRMSPVISVVSVQ